MANCKVCEYCGAHLDFGERCDCQDREDPREQVESSGGGS